MKISLFQRNMDSLTSDDLMNFYVKAYQVLNDETPDIQHLNANRYSVNGIERDRHWLLLEIELLYQQLIIAAGNTDNTSAIVRLVRRFQQVMSH